MTHIPIMLIEYLKYDEAAVFGFLDMTQTKQGSQMDILSCYARGGNHKSY